MGLSNAYAPFCTREAAGGLSLRPVPAGEVIRFHADFAADLPPDGGRIRIDVAE